MCLFQSLMEGGGTRNSSLMRKAPTMPKPQWHAPWKLSRVSLNWLGTSRPLFGFCFFYLCIYSCLLGLFITVLCFLWQVISGHLGWVRSIAVEPGNQWFVTGSADRTIKVSLGDIHLTTLYCRSKHVSNVQILRMDEKNIFSKFSRSLISIPI